MSIIRFHTATDLSPNERPITAAPTLEDSTEIDIRDFAGGGIGLDYIGSVPSIWYYVASKPGGDFHPLCDRDDAAISQGIHPGQAYALPDEIFGFGALKMLTINEPIPATVSLKG